MIATALPGDWLGYIAATLTTAAFVPQALKTLRSRDTRALSLGMYLIFTVGIAFWLGYGLVLGSWPIILSNSLTLVLAGIILVLKLRHG
jgi:MtN3 and saliva related transmembrane protein